MIFRGNDFRDIIVQEINFREIVIRGKNYSGKCNSGKRVWGNDRESIFTICVILMGVNVLLGQMMGTFAYSHSLLSVL